MRYKNLVIKASIITILVVLILCLCAFLKFDKLNSESISITQSAYETEKILATRPQKPTSGTCGESATWTYDVESRTLTIKGTGYVDDNSSINKWAVSTKKLVIEDGITGFYGSFLDDFKNVSDIDLPNIPIDITGNVFSETAYYKDSNNWDNGVLYIDNYLVNALETTSGKYTVKNGTIAICAGAFFRSEISEIVLPDSVVKIGGKALSKCYLLKKIYIGSGLQDFSESVFGEGTEIEGYIGPCLLENIEVSKDNKYLYSENGVLYNKEKTELLWYPYSSSIKEFLVPDTVQTISSCAFIGAANLETLTLSDNLILPDFWLYGCISLKRINIGSSLLSSERISEMVYGCTSLQFISVHEKNQNYSSVDGVLFNKNKTTLIIYPVAKKDTEYEIPDSVTTLADKAFEETVYLEKLFIGKNVVNLETCSVGCFNCSYKIYYEGTSDQWESISSELYDDFYVENYGEYYSKPTVYYNSEKFSKASKFNWF